MTSTPALPLALISTPDRSLPRRSLVIHDAEDQRQSLRDLHLAAECCLLRAALFSAERKIAEQIDTLKFGVSCVNSMGAAIQRMKVEIADLKQHNERLTTALHRAQSPR